MKPKNDKEKYAKMFNFGSQKPLKMRSKIQKIQSKKMIGKYVQQGWDRNPGDRGNQGCHTKGGDCLGISPPSQKGKESKETKK